MKQTDPYFSIVVPTRNRPDSLARLLDSVEDQKDGCVEVIVIDDASAEPVKVEPAYRTAVTVLRRDKSEGACSARNLGIEKARGDWIVFLDDDIEFADAGVLQRLARFVDAKPDFGVVGLAELTPNGDWGFNLGSDEAVLEVARFYGCGVAFKSECLAQSGGFFEPLGYYYEEFELSMRVINAGWRIAFHPDLRIIHHRDPVGRDARKIRRLISRNALITAAMRFPIWMVPPAWALQLARFTSQSWLRKPSDWSGPFIVAFTACQISIANATSRVPLKAAALRRYRKLAKLPIRLGSVGEESPI